MKYAILVLAALVILLVPAAAKADTSFIDTFDSTSMNTGMWSYESWGGNLSQSNNVLNFTGTGGDASYNSNFVFDLNHDFYATAQFKYDTSTEAQGGVGLGIYSMDMGAGGYNSKYNGSINAVYGTDDEHPLNSYFWGELSQWDAAEDNYVAVAADGAVRTGSKGWFGVSYNSTLDILQVGAFSAQPINGSLENLIWGKTFTGLKDELVDDRIGFYLRGWAEDGYTVGADIAYLDTFSAMTTGTATTAPEPVSTTLFILGGATLAARRLRGKK